MHVPCALCGPPHLYIPLPASSYPGIGWCRRWRSLTLPQWRQKAREAKADTPGDSAQDLERGTILLVKRLLLKSVLVLFSEGFASCSLLPRQLCSLLPGWQMTYTVISSPNTDGSSWITSPLYSHFSLTCACSSLSSLPNRLKEWFLPSLPLVASHLLCGRTQRAGALCMPEDTSPQTLLWTRAGFLLCPQSFFGS